MCWRAGRRLRYDGTYAVHRWHHLWFGKHKDKDVKPWDRKEDEVRTCRGSAPGQWENVVESQPAGLTMDVVCVSGTGRVGERRGISAGLYDDGSCTRQRGRESGKT